MTGDLMGGKGRLSALAPMLLLSEVLPGISTPLELSLCEENVILDFTLLEKLSVGLFGSITLFVESESLLAYLLFSWEGYEILDSRAAASASARATRHIKKSGISSNMRLMKLLYARGCMYRKMPK